MKPLIDMPAEKRGETLHTGGEAEAALGLDVLATIPPRRDGTRAEPVFVTRPYSPTARAFSSLRMVLELKNRVKRPVILFAGGASSRPAKTFCAVNCAAALAQQGHCTLLIDTDVEQAGVSQSLGLKPIQPQGRDRLLGTTRTGQVVMPSEVPDLFVLTTGAPSADGRNGTPGWCLADLVGDDLFFSFFERIVFDTAPLDGPSDAPALARHATTTCLVVEAGRTTAGEAQHAHGLLQNAQARDIGIVLQESKL